MKFGKTREEFLPALENMWKRLDQDKFILKLGSSEQIVITKPQDVEVLLSSTSQLEKNDLFANLFSKFVPDSLLITNRNRWRQLRKILNPAFNFKILEYYINIFHEEINSLISYFLTHMHEDIDVLPIFSKRALLIFCKAGIGFDISSQKEIQQYLTALESMLMITNERFFSFWKKIDFFYQFSSEGKIFQKHLRFIRKVHTDIIKIKKVQLKDLIEKVNSGQENLESISKSENSVKRYSFLELLLLARKENNQPLTDDEIINEVTLFILGAYETTAASTSFALHNLALHPDVQEMAFKEQIEITNGDLQKLITFQDLNNMQYLERVIKESMRIFPPVIFFGRRITEQTLISDGIELPVGSNVLLMPYLTHKDPNVFPNPDIFDPDRFLNKVTNYMFFPFSAGPRNCIGQKIGMLEMKFWIASIFRNMVILPSKEKKIQLVAQVVLKSSTGIHVRFQKR